ncbi:hypothetical protein N7474_009310 [Penicillium riverlandense]|uniref:uncharacterized protein n=1 Tax=Penicillium riverlandense TaxID=1903569 RepID=UPI002546FCBD|nr:uncharacterized protein N7474_009310 [Penicillium riverlandense]KAJ5808041.1 hypothetical protein N7474_009310 [Penicillium riverlandense]
MSNKPGHKHPGAGSATHSNEQNTYESSAPVTGGRPRDAGDVRGPSGPHYGEVTKAIAAEPSYDRELLFELFETVRRADRSHEQKLLEMIQDRKPVQQLRAFLEGMLANAGLSELNDQIVGRSRRAEIENDAPSVRPMVMDIHYLCDIVPYRVPAKPWTTVTDSDDLVSHLVSLYLTWGYPFYAFFCRETFVKHMRSGQLNSDFCSPFLVNALLANACFYSDYSEAYSLPGDVKRKGAHFLAEAERHLKSHQFESGSDIRLASLQASLLLYERYSMDGTDDFGYTMLHRAIGMAESLGIVNSARKPRLEEPYMSKDMISSLKRTAWGLFQIDTIVHMNFLRQSHIKDVNVDRIDREETPLDELWTPYPIQREPRYSYMSLYFDEACKLSYIARDTALEMPRALMDVKLKQEVYSRLQEWGRKLPRIFDPKEVQAPYILILMMRYHTLVINLWCYDLQDNLASIKASEDTPDSAIPDSYAVKIALSSARDIAYLIEVYRAEYGLIYCHQFAMYAINVSLFCMLAQESFDILDSDFLSLTSAFSTVACRTKVGRHLFHAFKLSVRSRTQGGQSLNTDDVSPVIRELFGPREKPGEPDRWDHYAEGLAEVEGGGSFLGELDMDPIVPGLVDMLKWYERMSIGKGIRWRGNSRDPAF